MDISILVFAEVVYCVDGVFLEIRERFEKLCNVHGSQAFEGRMGRMGKLNGVDQRISSLRGGRTRIRIRGPCIRGGGKWDRRTTEFVGGPRRSARAKSSTAWRSCSAILGGIIIPALVVVVVAAHNNQVALSLDNSHARGTDTPRPGNMT